MKINLKERNDQNLLSRPWQLKINKYIKILLLLFVFFGLLSVGYFFIKRQIITPKSKEFQEQNFTIKKGESLRDISKHLEEGGLIGQDYWFKFYVLTKGWAADIQAGEYFLSPSMNIPEIAKKVVGGKAISQDIQITIPEGFTVKQIDARLVKAGLINENELINFDKNLEGFLFPDTYKFDRGSSIENIVAKIQDNFSRKLNKDLQSEIEKQNKTIFEIITMASIIQNEALNNKEMPTIASVFYNRIKIDMLLQSDATVNYATGKNFRQPTISDTKTDSPYNTYLYKGLPPGPISNPGLDAIKAAIYPKETNYFFFLHPRNSSAVFSRTAEEHNQNKAKWLP